MFTLPAQITNGSWLCYCSWVPFCFSNWCSMPATPTLVTSTASVYRAYVSRCSQVSYQDPGYTKTPTSRFCTMDGISLQYSNLFYICQYFFSQQFLLRNNHFYYSILHRTIRLLNENNTFIAWNCVIWKGLHDHDYIARNIKFIYCLECVD